MSYFPAPRRWERYVAPMLLFALLSLLWYYLVWVTNTKVFPSPIDVGKGVFELGRRGLLLEYAGDSLRRVAAGFSAAAIMGVPLGLALGWYPAAGQVVNPLIQMLRPISPIAWIPISIVWFGIGDGAAIYLIFLSAFFPIVVASMNAARDVPPMLHQAGLNFGLGPVQLLARVIFPACVPQILVGLRIALGIAWLVVVAAEMIAVDSGLGYLVIDARNSGKRYDLVVAAMLIIGLIGLSLDVIFRQVETMKALKWGFQNDA